MFLVTSIIFALLLILTPSTVSAQSQTIDLDSQIHLSSIGESNQFFFADIADYVVVSQDSVFILDQQDCRVYLYTLEGKHLLSFGREGQGPGEFIDPIAIDYYNSNVYVLDKSLRRINIYDSSGSYIRSLYSKEWPTDLCVNAHGIYISVRSTNTIVNYIPHTNNTPQQVLLSYSSFKELEDVPHFYRLGSPLLGCTNDMIVIALPHTGNVVVYDINAKKYTCIVPAIVKDKTNNIHQYWKSLTERTLPVKITNVFHGMSIWDSNHVLLSLAFERNNQYLTHCVIVTLTDDDKYVNLISRMVPHYNISKYESLMISLRADNATFNVFALSSPLLEINK